MLFCQLQQVLGRKELAYKDEGAGKAAPKRHCPAAFSNKRWPRSPEARLERGNAALPGDLSSASPEVTARNLPDRHLPSSRMNGCLRKASVRVRRGRGTVGSPASLAYSNPTNHRARRSQPGPTSFSHPAGSAQPRDQGAGLRPGTAPRADPASYAAPDQ